MINLITLAVAAPYKLVITTHLYNSMHACNDVSYFFLQANNATEEIADADHYPLIRTFTADRKNASSPQTELLGVSQPWALASSSECACYYSGTSWHNGKPSK